MSREEMDQILKHVRAAGAEKVIREELQNPRPLAEIISGVTDPTVKADIYTLAFAIVRADQRVSGVERIYPRNWRTIWGSIRKRLRGLKRQRPPASRAQRDSSVRAGPFAEVRAPQP